MYIYHIWMLFIGLCTWLWRFLQILAHLVFQHGLDSTNRMAYYSYDYTTLFHRNHKPLRVWVYVYKRCAGLLALDILAFGAVKAIAMTTTEFVTSIGTKLNENTGRHITWIHTYFLKHFFRTLMWRSITQTNVSTSVHAEVYVDVHHCTIGMFCEKSLRFLLMV